VTTIIQSAAAFNDPGQHREVYHEISHLWNVQDTDRPSPRLEEGLASFLEYLVMQEVIGEPTVDARANQLLEQLRSNLTRHPQWEKVPPIEYGQMNLTDLSYSVGALMFDLLNRSVGRETFNRIIAEYYSAFSNQGGNTEDFVQIARRISRKNLDTLFQEWVYTTGWTARIRENSSIHDLCQRYSASDV